MFVKTNRIVTAKPILVALVLILLGGAFAQVAYASPLHAGPLIAEDSGGDTTAPKLTSISANSLSIAKPGDLVLNLGLQEEETGISAINVLVVTDKPMNLLDGNHSVAVDVPIGTALYSGTKQVSIPMPENLKNGSWKVSSVELTDQAGNYRVYIGVDGKLVDQDFFNTDQADANSLPGIIFQVSGKEGDVTPPRLSSATLASDKVAKPGEAIVNLMVDGEQTGLVEAEVSLANAGPNGSGLTGKAEFDSPVKSGVAKVAIPIDASTRVGDYVLHSITLKDKAGNISFYGVGEESLYGSQGKLGCADFDDVSLIDRVTLSVVGSGEEDNVYPEITDIQLVEAGQTVYKPGVAHLKVSFVEEGSGVSRVSVQLRSDNGLMYANGDFWDEKSPLKTGSKIVSIPITADASVGGWRVDSVIVDDLAGNSIQYQVFDGAFREYRNGDTDEAGVVHGTGVTRPVISFNIADEFSYAFNSALSNPTLLSKLKGMAEGTAARVKIDGKGILPKAAFDAIRGHDRTIVCYKGGYQWIFNGRDVTGVSKDVDLSLKVGMVAAGEVGASEDVVRLTFADNGVLPGRAQVRFKSDYLYDTVGLMGTLRLYHDAGASYVLEDSDVDLVFDGTDKWCYVNVTHNSRFVVSPSTVRKSIANAKVELSARSFTYNGKVQRPKVKKVTLGGKKLPASRYKVSVPKSKAAGAYKVTVKAKGAGVTGSVTATYKIAKAKNTLIAKAKSKVLKASVKRGATFKKAKAFKVSKAKGKVTFRKTKGAGKIAVSKAGTVTVKVGLKAGAYTVKVKVTAAGNANYKKATKTVTLKFNVK